VRPGPSIPAATLALLAGAALSIGQPSDPSNFSTVINIPQDMPTISGGIGSDTQLNLRDDGAILDVIGGRFDAGPADGTGSNIEVNILGGTVGFRFFAQPGCTVLVSGGSIGSQFNMASGSQATISGGRFGSGLSLGGQCEILGGTIGPGLDARNGSTVKIAGGRIQRDIDTFLGSDLTITGDLFRLNDLPTVSLQSGGLAWGESLVGVLADGNPILITGLALRGSDLEPGTTTLEVVDLPAPDTTPRRIDSGLFTAKSGLARGETLTIGGTASLQDDFLVYDGVLNIEGGTVGRYFAAASGGSVSVTGGSIGSDSLALTGSHFDISGGRIGRSMTALSGSRVTLSGGRIGAALITATGSILEIYGSEFALNGEPIESLPEGIFGTGDTLTGVLADGTPLILSERAIIRDDEIADGVLVLVDTELPPPNAEPITISSAISTPSGIARQKVMHVTQGGLLPDEFLILDATLNITGGAVGRGMLAGPESHVSISAGSIGRGARILSGASFQMTGGSVEDGLYADSGSSVHIAAGALGAGASAGSGSIVSISGGSVGDHFRAHMNSTVNISGGSISPVIDRRSTGTFNIFGSRFVVDGMTIDEAQGYVLTQFSSLTATLADGSEFSLNDWFVPRGGGATFLLTLVAPPCPADLTTTGAATPGFEGFATPDGVANLDDIEFYLDAWLAQNPDIADLTTTGAASPGQAGYAVPDSVTDLDDLGYYLARWLEGCP